MKRRDFIRQATASTVLGFPMIVPRHVLGAGVVAPSDKIVFGSIGVGSKGTGDLRAWLAKDDVVVKAVCDVRDASSQSAKSLVDARNGDKSCVIYKDFRELLARTDIDAVNIAPGERWHTLMSIEAARRRKHIFCQKPIALTVEESKAVREAVQRYGVAFQLGAQQRSSAMFRFAVELVRNGKIGK